MGVWTEHKRIMTVQEFSASISEQKRCFQPPVALHSNVTLTSLGLDKPKYLPSSVSAR